MAIFQGRYSWDGTKSNDKDPISWFPGAYDLKIINLGSLSETIEYLRPYICIFTNTGKGYSVSANPEKFAKRICEDFGLNMEKVLWVEQVEPGKSEFEIITFRKKGQLGEHIFYSMAKRKPMPNELQLLQKEINTDN